MKTQIYKGAFLLLISSCILSCQKETKEVNQEQNVKEHFNQQLDGFVQKLPSVEQRAPFPERLVVSPKSQALMLGEKGEGYSNILPVNVQTEEYEQAKQFEEQLLFSDDQEIFYPGALVKAQTVVDGSYLPIAAPRKPITLSVSLQGKQGVNPSVKVENPRLSTVRTAISDLLAKDFQVPPANIIYSYEEVHDEQHLKIAMGGSYNGTATKVNASAGFSYSREKTRFLVKIQQVYYTVDLDIPTNPSEFFAENFDYQTAFGNVKPVYISSIKMGRVLLLGIETSLSKKEAEAKINASILSGTFDAKAEVEYKDLQKSSKITGRVLGGNAKLGGEAITSIEQIKKFVTEGAGFDKDNPGIAVSYKLRELGTNSPFKTVIYSKYFKKSNKISFDLLIKDNMKSISGQHKPTGRGYIRRLNKKNILSENQFYFSQGGISPILAYEKGENLQIEFRYDKKEESNILFDITSEIDKLLDLTFKNGENPYDIDKNGLLVKDKDGKYVLKIGIHNAKIE
ncbi:thiol-activated cytolysin family protein [Capnocytophaga catalasegens]|uniref:Thiol-activated cytolysin n=1 Tax=Capnocytophaga catalasegens TaxID=1004260 RepID=A0AAV5AZV5_9FLAO|nr:thiol-activated cytolysin family protein [Capnocytophaga catalasegens]GIZ14004.1 hypothetical protein RCZ03_00050 [Capnocytophaga catalasegens]GJM51111.1 hypothetical protein RCZ15_20840 [Capnocytophaga catalasegens]GJM54080.1 hypothetical protein RCZ16_23960 [Capnocytophaga catalasegens]